MPIYRYRCSQGHMAEKLRPMSVVTDLCFCGANAKRQSVYAVAHIGRAAVPRDERSYRKSYAEYREAVADVSDHFQRVNESRSPHEQVKEPNYFAFAKAQARKKGVKLNNV